MIRVCAGVIMLALVVCLLVCTDIQAGDKVSPWKPILDDNAYKTLKDRSIERIVGIAKSDAKDAKAKIIVEAALLAGYTKSVKNADAPEVVRVRIAALTAHRLSPKDWASFNTLADQAPKDKEGNDPKLSLQSLQDMMEVFRNKSKGGEGLHADLQYSPQLKNLNGLEALISALAKKKLNDDNLAKVSKELPLVAYRVAVLSSLTHEFAPDKGAGQWKEISLQMRDASVALAEASKKKSAEGVLSAATTLEATCTQCHSAFRPK